MLEVVETKKESCIKSGNFVKNRVGITQFKFTSIMDSMTKRKNRKKKKT